MEDMSMVCFCRLKQLASRLEEFHVFIDNEEELRLLEQNPVPNKTWSVFIEVDCGYGRGLLHCKYY